jgi:thiamine-phosphate pyrophosphorylase
VAARPRVPSLVLVTDRHATGGRDLVDVVAAAVAAGCPAVQLREKDLPGRALFALAERLRATTARAGALLLVNDRIDVVIAVGADGVHLGGGSMPASVARGLLPATALVGVSTHSSAECAAAVDADFVFFGPVHATPAKSGSPQGLELLREAVTATSHPVLAIGGIDAGAVAAVQAAGAAGVAVIRALCAAADPGAATRALLAALRP